MKAAIVHREHHLDLIVDPLRRADLRRYPRSTIDAFLDRQAPDAVLRELRAERLDPLWADSVLSEALCPKSWEPALRRVVTASVARSLQLESCARRAATALRRVGVPFVVFKGWHLGRLLYGAPWHRVAIDSDLLVPRCDAKRAVAALESDGFVARPTSKNLSHELQLTHSGSSIDLHWDVMRPSRMRHSLTAEILERRVEVGDLPTPCSTHAGVLLLVHPAITEHVSQALGRALDLCRWANLGDCPWNETVEVLGAAGLRSAAWSMIEWSRRWFDFDVPNEVLRALAPGAPKRAYLRAWLDADPGRLMLTWPNAVRAGFSLALHDTAPDAAAALLGFVESRLRPKRLSPLSG